MPENYQVNTEKFGKILHEKEKQLSTILDSTFEISKPFIGKKDINLFDHFGKLNSESINAQGFIVLIYLEDSLRFWSNNSVEVGSKIESSNLNNSIVNLNNAWYYVKNIHDKNIDIFGLIKIRNDYSYENDYLQNEFQADFKLPSSIQISMVPLSYSYDIYDSENKYLFSLVPTNTIYSKNDNWKYLGFIYFVCIAFIFLFFDKWFRFMSLQHQKPQWKMGLIILFLIFTRYLMLEFKYPLQIYSLSFYEPEHFAVSYLFPSLGDFYINSVFVLFLTRSFFYIFRSGAIIRFINKKPKIIRFVFGIAAMLILILYFNYIIRLIESLVINSSIPLEAHKVLDLDLFSILAYTIFGLLLSAIVYLSGRILFITRQVLKMKAFLIILCSVVIIYGSIAFIFKIDLSSASLVYLLALLGIVTYIQTRHYRYYYSFYIVLIAIGAIYITFFINNTISEKEKDESGLLISKLVNERDIVAEHLLQSINENLKNDEALQNSVETNGNSQLDKVHSFLMKNYFNGYFAKYDLDIVVCSNSAGFEQSKMLANCAKYYGNIIDEFGNQIENSDFYYIDKHTGRVTYQGSVKFNSNSGKSESVLYIMLDSKLITQEIGYPDLLIEGKMSKTSAMSGYSYAKYQNGQLLTRSGVFPYDLNDKMFRISSERISNLSSEDYNHTIMNDGITRIVLSKPRVKGFDQVIAFSYIFVFFNILLIVILALNNLNSIWKQMLISFENKLLITMLFILALSFAMVTAGTVYYNTAQFENKHFTNISEKLESVQKNLELEEEKGLLSDTLNIFKNPGRLNDVLKGLSNIYYTDINLYDYSGRLVASSRPEIFTRGLIGTLMNPFAYKQMGVNEKIRYIQNENIGQLQYSSAYALFKPQSKQKPYFINLPYFSKPAELRKETSNLIVAIINLYVVLFIVVALVSFLLANKITQPLRMLQGKFQHIELGRQSEQIVYNKKDEIGALVNEYNRMVVQLAESIELLARTERETAWREMAKQIAHEIKNPLTPMKLSVQFLQRSWQDKDSTFDKKLDKCTKTLIDQINTLSNIATEFSNFAKMPKPNREVVNLVITIENIITLFSNTENLKMTTNIDGFDKLLIISDHEHISRSITNLVKNGIQAIPDDKEGIIQIIVEKKGAIVRISIKDNGSGISEDQKDKLFIPNFTTKSSGMGMGLPIVKDIIESAKGKIWFETELGVGTTFIVEFPLASEEEVAELSIVEAGKN
jgi:signal transduction histidine kinase